MASKHPHAGQVFLFEVLDVSETEPDLTSDKEMLDSADRMESDAIYHSDGYLPAPGEIFFCQDWAGGLWYALDGRGRALVVH